MSSSLASRAAASLRLRALDARDWIGGEHDPLVPPRRRQFVGEGDFVALGDEYLRHFRELAGLTASSRVLDVGSGIGRIARPLAGFLGPAGAYDGFDPDPDGVRWCRQAYGGAAQPAARFTFTHVDVFNARYRPAGTIDPAALRFPYADAAFDLVVMVSVLTHLLPDTLDNYLRESRRVLAPDGRLCGTMFLLDEASRAAAAAGRAHPAFRVGGLEPGGCAIVDPAVPESAVAYDTADVEARLAAAGFGATATFLGDWAGDAGRASGRSYQDIVVAHA